MFIVQGVTLSIMKEPGGAVPAGFSSFFVGDVIPDLLLRRWQFCRRNPDLECNPQNALRDPRSMLSAVTRKQPVRTVLRCDASNF